MQAWHRLSGIISPYTLETVVYLFSIHDFYDNVLSCAQDCGPVGAMNFTRSQDTENDDDFHDFKNFTDLLSTFTFSVVLCYQMLFDLIIRNLVVYQTKHMA